MNKSRTHFPGIEPLEERIAPATLVNPTTVTYQDKNGDAVTVSISKSLFTQAKMAKLFTFDTGAVNGDNTAKQQLESLNIFNLGQAAKGLNISITATPVNGSSGIVDVGLIDASGLDLGTVIVGGDLGRINAGDLTHHAPGLGSLTVESLGERGTATQAPGGTLVSKISGPVGSITVNGDVDGAAIGIGGGVHGTLASLLITGNLNGGTTQYAGSIRAQGSITSAEVDGSIVGGAGASSGIIGTSKTFGMVLVEGSLIGGGGSFSGAILSTGAMNSVEIRGDVIGGSGDNSGQVGTASNLGSVKVDQSVIGGGGSKSGTILATGNIGSVTITTGLVGGTGIDSGEVASARNGGAIQIGSFGVPGPALKPLDGTFQGIEGNSGVRSGSVDAGGNFTSVTVYGSIQGYFSGSESAPGAGAGTVQAGGQLPNVVVTGNLDRALIVSTGDLGAVNVSGLIEDGTVIHAHGGIQSVTASGVTDSTVVADTGGIGPILVNGGVVSDIANSTFRAGQGIARITANTGTYSAAITNSGFDAGGSIGGINTQGTITGSVFIAGIDLGSGFGVTGAGTFDNASAASFGFGSSSSATSAQIGAITVVDNAGDGVSIQQSTFLAGVHGAGLDKTFGTADDVVAKGSAVGAITTPNGMGTVFVESGNIGATNSGPITGTTYIATDTAVTAGGIGPITVNAGTPVVNFVPLKAQPLVATAGTVGIYNSTFTSNAGIGAINVTIVGGRGTGENAGISSTTFKAGHAIAAVTVTNNASGSAGFNYGIHNTTINAGIDGNGGIGDINVSLTDMGVDGNSVAIQGLNADATVCGCMQANMGSITAVNADGATSQSDISNAPPAGIVDSVFRAYGNIGNITSNLTSGDADSPDATLPAVQGSTFSAYGSIGAINVEGSVLADASPSRFLAGYDIGADMAFGNEDLGAHSLALQGGQAIGSVTVTGYFKGSDIAASVNPGAGYVFGDSPSVASAASDTNIGSGGTIGLVNLGTQIYSDGSPLVSDGPAQHGIEAKTFAGSVTVSGFTHPVPCLLEVEGGAGDVRITNLSVSG